MDHFQQAVVNMVKYCRNIIPILGLLICSALTSGCSSLEAGRYLSLASSDREHHAVERHDWVTASRYPFFGELRPTLTRITFTGKGDLVIYPVILGRSNFDGPLLLPVVPYPRSLNVPEERNVLRMAYSGNPGDIRIEEVDGQAVDWANVKRVVVDSHATYSLLLSDAVVSDGALVVEVLCRDERETLVYSSVRTTSFFPFVLPLGAD